MYKRWPFDLSIFIAHKRVFLRALGTSLEYHYHNLLSSLITSLLLVPIFLTLATGATLLTHWHTFSHMWAQQQHLYLYIQPQTSDQDLHQLQQSLTQQYPLEILHITYPKQGLAQLVQQHKLPKQVSNLPAAMILPTLIEARRTDNFSAAQFLLLCAQLRHIQKIERIDYDTLSLEAYAYLQPVYRLILILFVCALILYLGVHRIFFNKQLLSLQPLIRWHYQQGHPLDWVVQTIFCTGLCLITLTTLWAFLALLAGHGTFSPLLNTPGTSPITTVTMAQFAPLFTPHFHHLMGTIVLIFLSHHLISTTYVCQKTMRRLSQIPDKTNFNAGKN